MRVDRPDADGDDVGGDGDRVPDEQLADGAKPEAYRAAAPAETRNRLEHAHDVRSARDATPSALEPVDQDDSADSPAPADQEEHPPEDSESAPHPVDSPEPDPPGAPEADSPAPPPDRPTPLTDKQWAEHIADVKKNLSAAYDQGLATDCAYTLDGMGEVWLEEREYLHDVILEDIYAKATDVPRNFKAVMAGGLGGAGKTTILTQHAGIDLSQYLMINPDDIKEEMARRGMIPELDQLSPMEASELGHEESSYLAKRLAHRAYADGKNVIWDITMSSESSTAGRIDDLHKAGYNQIDAIFVDISIETSIKRMESRHRQGHEDWRARHGLGGRYVPPEVMESQVDPQWRSRNRRTYEAVKERFTHWSTYDNSVDGRRPKLIERS